MLQEHSQRTLMPPPPKKQTKKKKMYTNNGMRDSTSEAHRLSPWASPASTPSSATTSASAAPTSSHCQHTGDWIITIKHSIKRITILTNLVGSMNQNKLNINQWKEGPDAF